MEMRYRLRGLPIGLRLFIYLSAAIAGILLQNMVRGGVVPGTLLVILATLPMWAKSYDNKPKDLGYEEWKPVSFREIERVRANISQTKDRKVGCLFRQAAFGLLILPTIVIGFFGIALSLAELGPGMLFFAADWFILGLPLFGGGKIRLWKPNELAMKLKAFDAIIDDSREGRLVTTPYLRFDKDSEGREIPEDIRFMIELRRSPDDFVGAQFQVAINKGPNGAVPYMYAVYLCRGQGRSFKALSAAGFGSYLAETGGDKEFSTIVIRQQTSGSGYHTTGNECEQLYKLVTTTMIERL